MPIHLIQKKVRERGIPRWKPSMNTSFENEFVLLLYFRLLEFFVHARVHYCALKCIMGLGSEKGPCAYYKISQEGTSKLTSAIKMYYA